MGAIVMQSKLTKKEKESVSSHQETVVKLGLGIEASGIRNTVSTTSQIRKSCKTFCTDELRHWAVRTSSLCRVAKRSISDFYATFIDHVAYFDTGIRVQVFFMGYTGAVMLKETFAKLGERHEVQDVRNTGGGTYLMK
ncbi:MAG: hypothetical protein ORN21_04120 [Methylophilaceae bacterium]|nr:hypothetical protein [Methylophilaceae bacterium]